MLPLAAQAQTGDAGSGWANWILTKIEAVKQEIRDNEQIAKTVELVNLYKQTKELTGVIASSVKDLNTTTTKFQNDTRTVDLVTQSQLDQLNDFVSWDETLRGTGYQPLAKMSDWYDDAVGTFRNENGNLNVTSLFSSTLSLQEQIRRQEIYKATFLKIRGQKAVYEDHEVRRLLRLADEYDNQARHLVIKLNIAVFNRGLSNVSKSLGKTFSSEENKDDKNKVKRSDEDIQAQVQQVYDLQDKAARVRGEALERLRKLMAEDLNTYTVDLLTIHQKSRRKSQALPTLTVPDRFIHPEVQVTDDW